MFKRIRKRIVAGVAAGGLMFSVLALSGCPRQEYDAKLGLDRPYFSDASMGLPGAPSDVMFNPQPEPPRWIFGW